MSRWVDGLQGLRRFADARRFFLQNLYEKLDDKDKELFYFDMEQLNWRDFIGQSMLGIRTYLMKEDPKNIPEARKRFHRWVLGF